MDGKNIGTQVKLKKYSCIYRKSHKLSSKQPLLFQTSIFALLNFFLLPFVLSIYFIFIYNQIFKQRLVYRMVVSNTVWGHELVTFFYLDSKYFIDIKLRDLGSMCLSDLRDQKLFLNCLIEKEIYKNCHLIKH